MQIKLGTAKDKFVFEEDEFKTTIKSGDPVRVYEVKDDKVVLLVNSYHYEVDKDKVEVTDENIERFAERIAQRFLKDYLKLRETIKKDFEIDEENRSLLLSYHDDKEKQIQEWLDEVQSKYEFNTTPTVVLLDTRAQEKLPFDSSFTFGELKGCVINDLQIVCVDIVQEVTKDLIKHFKEGVKGFNALTPEEVNGIESRKMAKHWTQSIDDKIRKQKENIDKHRKSIQEYRETLSREHEQVTQLSNALKAFQEIKDGGVDYVSKRIGEINTLDFVKEIELKEGEIIVHLNDVVETFELKGQTWEIPFNDPKVYMKRGKIRMTTSNAVEVGGTRFDHMHCRGDFQGQDLCLGSSTDTMYEKLGNWNFKQVVFYMRVLIGTYNNSSPHISLKNFIEARKDQYGDVKKVKKKKAKAEKF